jgi:ribonuclease I
MHGLWPTYSNGKKMDKCNTGSDVKITRQQSKLFDEMMTYWVSFTKDEDDFWSHEYNTHGFCYMRKYKKQNPADYFEYALDIFMKNDLANLLQKAVGPRSKQGDIDFDYHDIVDHIRSVTTNFNFEITCLLQGDRQYLQEIRFFFDLNLNPVSLAKRGNCDPNYPVYVHFQ